MSMPLLIAAASLAIPPVDLSSQVHEARIVGHLYLNAATGERVRMPYGGRDGSPLRYDNTATNGHFWSMGDGDGLCTTQTDEGLDWFDVCDPLWENEYDCLQFGYATDRLDPGATGAAGLEVLMQFYNLENGNGDPDLDLAGGYIVTGLPGSSTGTFVAGWLVTIDLTGVELDVESTDEDGDGRSDLGYSVIFSFDPTGGANGTGDMTGPLLCDGTDVRGQVNAFDLYRNDSCDGSKDAFVETAWFGGTPWASWYLAMYGDECECLVCVAEWPGPNGIDCVLDIFDIIYFLEDFDAGDPSTDLNGDTVIDVFDVIRFLDIFDAGC